MVTFISGARANQATDLLSRESPHVPSKGHRDKDLLLDNLEALEEQNRRRRGRQCTARQNFGSIDLSSSWNEQIETDIQLSNDATSRQRAVKETSLDSLWNVVYGYVTFYQILKYLMLLLSRLMASLPCLLRVSLKVNAIIMYFAFVVHWSLSVSFAPRFARSNISSQSQVLIVACWSQNIVVESK